MKKILPLLLTMIVAGCAKPEMEISLAEHMPDKIEDAVRGALRFWTRHGADFTLTDDAETIIYMDDLQQQDERFIIGQCDCNGVQGLTGPYSIALDLRLLSDARFTPRGRECVIAHELGHYIGMDHVSDKESLLSARIPDFSVGDCSWSEFDSEEYCRARPDLCINE